MDPVGTADLCLKSGDAFLFENRIFRTLAPSLSQRTLKTILFGYSYCWMGGRTSNMDQVNDIRQQLLGGDSDAVIH